MKKSRLFCVFVLLGCVLFQAGCSSVKPWEKRHLSRAHMALDTDPLESRTQRHLYQSKEGTFGGYGIGGGGCGCS
jgi:hypothetical protein